MGRELKIVCIRIVLVTSNNSGPFSAVWAPLAPVHRAKHHSRPLHGGRFSVKISRRLNLQETWHGGNVLLLYSSLEVASHFFDERYISLDNRPQKAVLGNFGKNKK